jgi:hypothetical protein
MRDIGARSQAGSWPVFLGDSLAIDIIAMRARSVVGKMNLWLSNAPPLVGYLIGITAIMAGVVLFVGALLFRVKRTNRSEIPSMRGQMNTIPPRYQARKVDGGARLNRALRAERSLRTRAGS